MICATHTHSAPAFNIFATPRRRREAAEGRSAEWERALPRKIAAAIVRANEKRENPRRSRVARTRFTLGTNRRLMRADGKIQIAANYPGVADDAARALGAYSTARRQRDRRYSQLSVPRRRAVRGQPALLARLAGLRDG